MDLKEKLLSKSANVAVIGLGYVGLPLSLEFCRAGFNVIGIDVDEAKINMLKKGTSYVLDVPDVEVKSGVTEGKLIPSTDFEMLKEADAVSICVPTPLRKSKEPDLSYIVSAVDELKKRLHPNMVIVLESTTYPGTTEEVIKTQIEEQGYRVGEDVFLCFSPERVDPGNKAYVTRNIPKVVGGVTPACTDMGVLWYSQVMEKVVPVSCARTAEMVKLLENTFRSVNIALVNEMAQMCDRMGMDIWEVIDAAATKPFGFMPFYPGPGIGGHCLPLDPIYLSWKAKTYGFYNRFIELASDINGNMPYYIVQRIADVLNLEGKALSTSEILCLGVAYKKNVSDTRESPGIEVMKMLKQHGAVVKYSDPYVPVIKEDGITDRSIEITKESLETADCVVLLTDHSSFDYDLIADHARLVLDTRNAFKGREKPNIFRIGTGLPTPEEFQSHVQLNGRVDCEGEVIE